MSARTIKQTLQRPWMILAIGLAVTVAIYIPGLSGGWIFDDFPNIVDNPGVHATNWDLPSLINAALSSPASDFKRPLASLSFAVDYLLWGGNPAAMKLTNLVIHLMNGIAAFLFIRALLCALQPEAHGRAARMAAAIASAWMLLPINLTAVLYVVQRMESMANLAVLLGLWGYIVGRLRMLEERRSPLLAMGSVIVATAIGAMAKETAVMLPLYAALIELFVFHARQDQSKPDIRVIAFFAAVLVAPLIAGAFWLLPGLLNPDTWITRDFTLKTRLLSEARVVFDYIVWSIAPSRSALSFYHDDFLISHSLFDPLTTLTSTCALGVLIVLSVWLRRRLPSAGLGIALFLGCHTLTGTVLPLELVYEHRNYFSSLGLLLACATSLASIPCKAVALRRSAIAATALLTCLWTYQTAATARAWGNPITLAQELALRAPLSPRAQYELGRTYIIASHYDPTSPFTKLAYAPLEQAARLPSSSILPEQALIFMNSKMHLPVREEWWDSMIAKLRARPATIQDESSLDALATCLRDASCDFPSERLYEAFGAALSHERRSPRLLAMYANFAWRTMHDGALAMRVQREAVAASPAEAAYRIGLAKYAIQQGDRDELANQVRALQAMNVGRRLDSDLAPLKAALGSNEAKSCDDSDRSCRE